MTEPRWYCLSREGMATLCTDKADAEMTAINADELYPRAGPHRAVQLVEAGPQPQQAAPSDPQPKGMPTNALASAVCSVAEARGFVAFGAGVYRIQETQEPGLVVTFRRDGEQHYGVGDLAPEVDTTPIQADDIIVRLQFTSVAGLDSLERHLRSIRVQHWPETAPSTAPAQTPAAPVQQVGERQAFEAWAETYSTFPLERDDAPTFGTTSYTVMEQAMLWDAWQARAALASQPAARVAPVHQPVHGWTDADADAARLALELECLLTDKDMPTPVISRWWDSAHEALRLHRERLDGIAAPAAGEKQP